MSIFKYHAFIYFLRPPPWRTEQYQSIGLALIFDLREYTKNQSIPRGANNISATGGTSVYIAEVGKVNFKSNSDEALSDESP
jgi:hypothetical protein